MVKFKYLVEDEDNSPISPDDFSLEEISNTGDVGEIESEDVLEELKMDYQYTIKVEEQTNPDPDIDKEYIFILAKKQEEGETPALPTDLPNTDEGDLVETDEIENNPLKDEKIKESVTEATNPAMEQQPSMEQTPPDSPTPDNDQVDESLPETENAEIGVYEFEQDQLISFLNSLDEFESTYSIDEDTEFSLEEALDWLKLYPDTTIYVKIDSDVAEFEAALTEHMANMDNLSAEVANEEQNISVNDDGESVELDSVDNKEVQKESFCLFNYKNKKNFPDGIYLANIIESKLYGRFEKVSFTKNNLIIGKNIFALKESIDLTTVKDQEEIKLFLKEEKDIEKLNKIMSENAEITIKL